MEKDNISNPSRRFHFLPVAELYSMPKPKWLIKHYLDVGTLAMFFAEPCSFKSFLALDIGLCIATGIDWHGCQVRSGPVFFIAGEGFGGLSCRIKAWEISHKINLEGIPFFTSDRPAQMLDATSAMEVTAAVDELSKIHGNPALIIIDTLNRNFGPGDESSTADMGRFINKIDDNLRIRYGCTVLIIHHTGWNEMARARGSSALRAALDWEYKLTKQANGTKVLLTCTKSKDHVPPPSITFLSEIISIDGWIDDDGDVMTSCIMKVTEAAARGENEKPLSRGERIAFDALLATIKDTGKQTVHINAWREAAYRMGISATPTQTAKKKAFQRAINGLRDAGYIKAEHDVWQPIKDMRQKRDNSGTCPSTLIGTDRDTPL